MKDWCFLTVVLENTLESPLDCKEIQPVHPKGDQSWVFIGRTDVEVETPILWPPDVKNWLIWKKPWFWERLRAGREGDNREWDSWMASPTRWTWVWWWTGRPGMLQFMGSQRVGHNWATELNWYQILKDDVGKVLYSVCQQIWKTQQWPQDCKTPVFVPIPKKSNAKECSN